MKTSSLPLIGLVALSSFTASATTHYVDLNCTNSVAPYLSWDTAATNIQQAVSFAAGGETVLVTNGVYRYGAGNSRVAVLNNITVQSVNGPAVTAIEGYQVPGTTNGPGAIRCAYLGNGAILSGFTLTNGATIAGEVGGGVKCAAANCLVTNCVIVGNSASTAGGAYSGTLINCAFLRNSSGWGGGANNSILVNCTFVGNISGYRGGGAAYSSLTNCVLIGNYAASYGGGADGSTVVNCTVVSNTAAQYGGGVEGGTILNSVVYYNNLLSVSPGNTNYHSLMAITNCCTTPMPVYGGNNITDPPLFANLTGGDLHLSAVSPCINAGNNAFVAAGVDFDGRPRIVAGTVDIGAYEFPSLIHYVKTGNFGPVPPYTNWITAATNIQDAIDAALAGDLILVSNGTYNVGERVVFGAMTNRVVIDKAVTVQSVNGAAATAIAGLRNANIPPNGIRCVYLTNGAALAGFTLTNGATLISGDLFQEQSGGGAWCNDDSVTISDCVFAGNAAARYGGGAFRGTLLNCTFTNNAASFGGGAASNVLVNSTLIRNSALYRNFNYGGGAYGGVLSNCLVVGNQAVAAGYGGGTALSTLNGCVVSNNFASYGGGVIFGTVNDTLISSNRAFSMGGGAASNTVNNCVLKNNCARDGGGAVGSALINCTVVSNSAFGDSGGLRGGAATNSIIFYNLSGSVGSNYLGSALSCCDTTPAASGPGNITNEPVFLDLVGGDFHLQSNSPSINSGNNALVVGGTDFDGNPRIAGGTVDMGACEFQSPSSILSYAWAQQFGLPIDGSADHADNDVDGLDNWQEWIAGTVPTDSGSVLVMSVPSPDVSGVTVTWQSVSGKIYFLQRATDFFAQPAFSLLQDYIVGQPGTTSYTDSSAAGDGPFFYRVGVRP